MTAPPPAPPAVAALLDRLDGEANRIDALGGDALVLLTVEEARALLTAARRGAADTTQEQKQDQG